MVEMPERRTAPRFEVPWHLGASMLDGREVRIVDLSTGGVGIEHAEPLQPGACCALEVSLPFGVLRLAARVVWSMLRDGSRFPYRSGIAFTGLTTEQHAALARALDTLRATRDVPEPEAAH
jgi:hypothetical protein